MARAERVANPKNVVVGAEPVATEIVAGVVGYSVTLDKELPSSSSTFWISILSLSSELNQ